VKHAYFYYMFLGLTVVLAFWKGAGSEKWGAATALSGSLASSLLGFDANWSKLIVDLMLVDLIVLTSFWWLSLRSDRFWPYWVTGWQLVAVLIHAQRALFDDILPAPYALMTMYLAYPMLALIICASIKRARHVGYQQG
jgi:hypothetical protein